MVGTKERQPRRTEFYPKGCERENSTIILAQAQGAPLMIGGSCEQEGCCSLKWRRLILPVPFSSQESECSNGQQTARPNTTTELWPTISVAEWSGPINDCQDSYFDVPASTSGPTRKNYIAMQTNYIGGPTSSSPASSFPWPTASSQGRPEAFPMQDPLLQQALCQ